MFRIAVVITSALFFASSLAQAAGCNTYLQAFNEYTQKVDGKLVKKHSIFEITEWARDSRYQGLLLTEKAPANAEVILESKASAKAKTVTTKTAKTKPFAQDNKYRIVDIDVQKQLGASPAAPGIYSVKVVAGGKTLCSDKKAVIDSGE